LATVSAEAFVASLFEKLELLDVKTARTLYAVALAFKPCAKLESVATPVEAL